MRHGFLSFGVDGEAALYGISWEKIIYHVC